MLLDLPTLVRRLAIVPLVLALLMPAMAASADTSTHRLSGRVTGSSGQALDQVAVELWQVEPAREVAQTHTTSDGRYVLDAVPTGSYTLHFYTSDPDHVSEYYGGSYRSSASEVVQVGDADLTGLDGQLDPAAHVLGRVTNASGQPVAGVRVGAYSLSDDGWYQASQSLTRADGSYDVGNLVPDRYLISFNGIYGVGGVSTYASEWWQDVQHPSQATPIDLSLGATRSQVDAELATPSILQGRVVPPAGSTDDLAGIQVCAWAALERTYDHQRSWSVDRCGLTDSAGRYRIASVLSGSIHLQVDDRRGRDTRYFSNFYPGVPTLAEGTQLDVPRSTTTTAPDLALQPGGRIAGTVSFGDGSSAEDVGISVWRRAGGTYAPFTASSASSADGSFVVSPLPTGTYRVRFDGTDSVGDISSWWDGATSLETARDITVTEGSTSAGIDVHLTRSATPTVPTPTTPGSTGAPTVPAPAPPAPTSPPTAPSVPKSVTTKGKAAVGSVVRVVGYPTGSTTAYSFTWYAGKKAVRKATSARLRLTSAMRGKVLSVAVTAKAGGASVTRTIRVGKVR